MSEPKTDEEIIKDIKSYLPKDSNAITDWWEFDRKTKATLAAVRKSERERAKDIVMNYPLSAWSGEAEVYDQLYEIAQRISPTQDDTNLSK